MRVHATAHFCQLTQPRVHDCDQLGAQSRIFGEIDASVNGSDQFIQLIEEWWESRGSNRKVESQRPSFDWEGEGPGTTWTESLEHGHGTRKAHPRDHRDRCTDEFGVAWSDSELILHESTLAIEEIPIRHSIERVQKRGQRDEGAALASCRLAKPGLIEYARGARTHEACGRGEG